MNPFWNVVLGCSMAILALTIAVLKLVFPASPWHRRGAYIVAFGSLWLMGTMGLRWWNYQQTLSWWSRLHVFLGIAVYLVFMAKFCSARRWYLNPKFLRPLGFALTALFPLTAFGMAFPFLAQSFTWTKLTISEVTQNPKQESFNKNCCICHNREKAVEKLGVRTEQRWIDITEPMAWAGSLDRESCRGALAAILAPPSVASGEIAGDPINRACLTCHSKTRVLQAKKKPGEWRQTVLRMQTYAKKNPKIRQITDDDVKEVLAILEKGINPKFLSPAANRP